MIELLSVGEGPGPENRDRLCIRVSECVRGRVSGWRNLPLSISSFWECVGGVRMWCVKEGCLVKRGGKG